MSEADALAHVTNQALVTVASTSNLSWAVKSRLVRQVVRAVRAHAYPYPSAEDFAAWAQEELADLLRDEDIRPLHRLALAGWFAAELLSWLTGDFDNAAD